MTSVIKKSPSAVVREFEVIVSLEKEIERR